MLLQMYTWKLFYYMILVTMDTTYVAHISDSGPISTVHCPFSVFLPTIEWA